MNLSREISSHSFTDTIIEEMNTKITKTATTTIIAVEMEADDMALITIVVMKVIKVATTLAVSQTINSSYEASQIISPKQT